MSKMIVTGGAGFIGSHIVDRLVADGHEVHVIDDLSLGSTKNLNAKAIFHEGSILDTELLDRVFPGTKYVFHQAALPSVPRSVEDPLASNLVNSHGALTVFWAANKYGIQRVMYAASSSAYGDIPGAMPKHESMPVNPQSPYAMSKVAAEFYGRIFTNIYGLEVVSLRYFNVYGPRQAPNGGYAAAVPRFFKAALEGKSIIVYGDGQQTRDFTFVGDVVEANMRATSADCAGKIINVGCESPTTVNELARLIIGLTKSQSQIEFQGARKGDVQHSSSNPMELNRVLGEWPRFSLEQGLESTVDSW